MNIIFKALAFAVGFLVAWTAELNNLEKFNHRVNLDGIGMYLLPILGGVASVYITSYAYEGLKKFWSVIRIKRRHKLRMKRRHKIVIAGGFSWVIVVSGYVFLAEPYGRPMFDSDWENFFSWTLIPPVIFFIVFSVFSWAVKEDTNGLEGEIANKPPPNETPVPKTNQTEKTPEEFDEVRFLNTAEIIRERFLSRVNKDKTAFLANTANELVNDWTSHFLCEHTAIKYSVAISMVAGIRKDMDYLIDDTKVRRLINRLNKNYEDILDFSSDTVKKLPRSPKSGILLEDQLAKIKLAAFDVAKNITKGDGVPFLPFYAAIWKGSAYLEYELHPKDKSKLSAVLKGWHKRFEGMMKADLRLLGEATGL